MKKQKFSYDEQDFEPQSNNNRVKYGDEEFEVKGGKLKPIHKVKKFK